MEHILLVITFLLTPVADGKTKVSYKTVAQIEQNLEDCLEIQKAVAAKNVLSLCIPAKELRDQEKPKSKQKEIEV
jgi:hypothetical protein